MKFAHRSMSRSALAAALLSLTMTAVAGPQSARIDERILQKPAGPEIPLTRQCADPFENHGNYTLGVNVSGAGASSAVIPAGKFLQLTYVTAKLKGSAPVAGDIGIVFAGKFGWHHMRVRNDAVEYKASSDGALYADGKTQVKFVASREHGFDQVVSGDYVIRGCIVDSLPPITTKPRIEVPYIPLTHWQSRGPIDAKPPVNKAPLKPIH